MVNVEQDEADRSYAVCKKENNKVDDELINNGRIIVFLVLAILLPMIFMGISAIIVRSFHKGIHTTIARRSGHDNLTGLALTGMMVTVYVLGCDIAAIVSALKNKEISQDTFDFVTLIFLAIYSGLSFILPALVLSYMCCKHINEYFPGQEYEAGCIIM